MQYSYSLMLITMSLLMSACGGGGGGETTNTVAATVDGSRQRLASTDDSFIPESNESNKLSNLTASNDQTFLASKKINVDLKFSTTTTCYLNIYNQYTVENNQITPQQDSRVLQLTSNDCAYNGPITVISQQQEVLIEVLEINVSPRFFTSNLETMVLVEI